VTDSTRAAAGARKIPVVLDVNVYLDYIGHAEGRILLPTQADIPSPSPAADTLALAFDDRHALFASPHILRNINRVMHENGQSEQTRRKFIEFIAETCQLTGGAIVDPIVRDHGIGDHEDNHILALAKDPAVDADVIVSSDHHLTDLGPAWNGRLIIKPRQFVSHMTRSAAAPTPTPVAAPQRTPAPTPSPRPTTESRAATRLDRFPELRGVTVDRFGLGDSDEPQSDDRQF
jgi:predicted nucleic acid-binding protein